MIHMLNELRDGLKAEEDAILRKMDGLKMLADAHSLCSVKPGATAEEYDKFVNRRGPVDRRWLAIARTNIEQGFMALNRAVFPEDIVGSAIQGGALRTKKVK